MSQGASKPGKKVRPSAKQRRKAMAKSKPSTEEGQDGEATKEDEEGKKAAAQAFREAKKKKVSVSLLGSLGGVTYLYGRPPVSM